MAAIKGELMLPQDAESVRITSVTKLKHTDLWKASKKLGSQAALARYLGVSQSELGRWVNLKVLPPPRTVPGTKWTEDYLMEIESKLSVVTGKSWDELFPQAMRRIVDEVDCGRMLEREIELESHAALTYAESVTNRLRIKSDPTTFINDGQYERLESALEGLSSREREAVRLSFGFEGEPQTLEQIGRQLSITRERVRQLIAKAIRKLQMPGILDEYSSEDDDIGEKNGLHPPPPEVILQAAER